MVSLHLPATSVMGRLKGSLGRPAWKVPVWGREGSSVIASVRGGWRVSGGEVVWGVDRKRDLGLGWTYERRNRE